MARQGEALIALARPARRPIASGLLLAIIALCEQADSAGALETPQVQGLLGRHLHHRGRGGPSAASASGWPRPGDGRLGSPRPDQHPGAGRTSRSPGRSSPPAPSSINDDLIRLLHEATIEHQIEVARRPSIAAPVVDAIVGQGAPAVLTALAMNPSAEITPAAHGAPDRALSRSVAPLRSPLAHHPRLTADLAGRLCVGRRIR
ncbi:MAG: DUF2336 domain-containing protein [Caulobacteraceae bacterium]